MYKWVKSNSIQINDDELLVEKLAKIRGVKNIEEWMNTPSSYVHSPYKLLNIEKVVEIILDAVYKEKNIIIVADIDTDGVCSAGTMFRYLIKITPNVKIIHAQRSDGHGVETVLDKIDGEDNVDLVIIVDSSTNSVEGCKYLYDKNIPVVIIDHHQIDKENPYATIVNCQMGDYPNKHLSGSAMCYKVCQVLDDYMDIEEADEYLDLCAIGIVADMMDVTNMENRYLIFQGMKEIKNAGVREILKQSKTDFKFGINSTNISFKIAPIIGACSRFDRIELAIELITSDDEKRNKALVKEMIVMNEQRKVNQKEYIENTKDSINSSNNIIIHVDNDVDSGFRGLIATEFAELFSKPVFVVSERYDDELKDYVYAGSARGIGEIDLKAICEDSGLFYEVQGHENAFGVTFYGKNLNNIISHFNNTLDSTALKKVFKYDIEIYVDDIDELDIKEVESFSRIVGTGFPDIKFLVRGLVVEEQETKKLGSHVRAVMGKNVDTIKINCEDEFALMKFRTNELYAKDVEDHFYNSGSFTTEVEAVGSLNLNNFFHGGLRRVITTKQVFLDDYRIVE